MTLASRRTRWTVVWVRHDMAVLILSLTIPPARTVDTGRETCRLSSHLQGVGRPPSARTCPCPELAADSVACHSPVYEGGTWPREAARCVRAFPRQRASGISAGSHSDSTGIRQPVP